MTTSSPDLPHRHPAEHLSHSELSTREQMTADCLAAEKELERVTRAATRPAPSLHYDDYPREVRKSSVNVDAAASRIANALHLYLD